MDREQHITQDAAEHYAVFIMAQESERLGIATSINSHEIYDVFRTYLTDRDWTLEDFEMRYPSYKVNVDSEIPKFVARLRDYYPKATFQFGIDEAEFRNKGLKADFTVQVSHPSKTHFISLKNYIGSEGISRPQVSSGTFLSFAAGFTFERVGVGTYIDPRSPSASFSGSKKTDRNAVLDYENRASLKLPLEILEGTQQHMRESLLTLRFYDEKKIKGVIADIVPKAHEAVLEIFSILGMQVVREKFLQRAGLDSKEGVLFFDKNNFVDSITNTKFAELLALVNDPTTSFNVEPVGQSLRFSFSHQSEVILAVDVPFTINTNGAWFRPKEKFEGTQVKIDKGHTVSLAWGEIRPYKSREIATSTNTYINLKATGIFD